MGKKCKNFTWRNKLKLTIKSRLKRIKTLKIEIEDIKKTNIVFFSVYSKSIDGAMYFKIICEFFEKYANKKYHILISKQFCHYIKEIVRNTDIWFANKKNPIKFFLKIYILKIAYPNQILIPPFSTDIAKNIVQEISNNLFLRKKNVQCKKI